MPGEVMFNARDTTHGPTKNVVAGPRPATPPEERATRSSGTVFDADPADNPIDLARDRAWLAALMNLLGRLEYGRALLDDPGHEKGGAAVKVAAALVEEVAGFAIENADPTAAAPAAEALARAQAFLNAAHAATSLGRKGLFGLFRGAADAPGRPSVIELLAELPLVLERYFILFGASFRDPAAAVQWVNTSGVFLTQLRRALTWADRPTR